VQVQTVADSWLLLFGTSRLPHLSSAWVGRTAYCARFITVSLQSARHAATIGESLFHRVSLRTRRCRLTPAALSVARFNPRFVRGGGTAKC
jgi:hypothetical protein